MLKVIEAFGGIGACTQALKNIGIDFEVVDYIDNDKYSVRSYNAINDTNFEPQDIRDWDKQIDVDLFSHGSPCINFSLAGREEGGDEGSGTQSSLMYESLRIIEKLRPKYVVWENVKNLLGKKHFHNFQNYLDRMEKFGYTNYYKVLDAQDYSIPQHRERVFTVSIRNDLAQDYVFPSSRVGPIPLKNLLEPTVDEKYFLSDSAMKTYSRAFRSRGKELDLNGICPTLVANMGRGGGNVPFFYDKGRPRKLTPKECWRLMGFPDEAFVKAREVNSDTRLYQEAGDSIVVTVLEDIFRNLLEDYK